MYTKITSCVTAYGQRGTSHLGLACITKKGSLNTNFRLERNFADFRLDALVSLASSKYQMIDTGFASLKCLKLIASPMQEC